MTISKAYSFLEKEGVVERRPGRPLVVKAFTTEHIHKRKINQLQESLLPTVTIVRQLGFSDEEALRIFSEMLGKETDVSAFDEGGGKS